MVIDLIVSKTDDGFTAEIPSLQGCETWAHTEDEVLDKISEMAKFYMNIDENTKLLIDRARGSVERRIYKIILKKK
jgi:predicted RNase H-like HicB family nuclease